MPKHKIDLNLLRVFDAVMSERNVTRASRMLNMTQPAVSNALSRLRYALDDTLFLKTPGGIQPTPKAESIWPALHAALSAIDQAINPAAFDPAQAEATVKIGMSDYVAYQLARPLFARLETRAPGVSIHLRPHTVEDIAKLLDSGFLDLAAGVFSSIHSPSLRSMPIETVPYVCAMRRDHPLATGRLTREKFLQARHLVISLSGRPSVIDRQLEEQGIKRNIGLVINNFSIASRILTETNLIGVFPASTIANSAYRDRLHVANSPVEIRPGTITLVWHARTDDIPLYRWLREEIFSLFGGEGAAPPRTAAEDM